MGHTPGPWKVADRFYILMDDEVACEVAKVCDENLDDDMVHQADADARLIAAAPELLAALKVICDHLLTLDSGDFGHGVKGWRDMDATAVDALVSSSFRTAYDAIHKAEGGE
jgi:hypothetical protein